MHRLYVFYRGRKISIKTSCVEKCMPKAEICAEKCMSKAKIYAEKCMSKAEIYAEKCIFALKICVEKCVFNYGTLCFTKTYRMEKHP